MNSTWEFVKRHKNKIAAAATLVGGVYATKKILDQQGYQPGSLIKQFSSLGNNASNPMLQVGLLIAFINITNKLVHFLVEKELYFR
jgi:hypothetical protein